MKDKKQSIIIRSTQFPRTHCGLQTWPPQTTPLTAHTPCHVSRLLIMYNQTLLSLITTSLDIYTLTFLNVLNFSACLPFKTLSFSSIRLNLLSHDSYIQH